MADDFCVQVSQDAFGADGASGPQGAEGVFGAPGGGAASVSQGAALLALGPNDMDPGPDGDADGELGGGPLNSYDFLSPGPDIISYSGPTNPVPQRNGANNNRRDKAYLQHVPHDRLYIVGNSKPYSPDDKRFGIFGDHIGTTQEDLDKFPELSFGDNTRLDLDYQFINLRVADLVEVFKQGFETLCWKKTLLRGTLRDLGVNPRTERLLYLASGPGVLFAKYNPWGPDGPP